MGSTFGGVRHWRLEGGGGLHSVFKGGQMPLMLAGETQNTQKTSDLEKAALCSWWYEASRSW